MGTLYLVATPIGNLGDLSPRAVETLSRADIIAAEDTRHTRKLLTAAGISPRELVAYHEHNEKEEARVLVDALKSGRDVALVCDSGTPAISDPGYRVVRLAIDEGQDVVPIPGPNAAVALLSASGLPTDRFLFVGFPPPKEGARRKFIEEVSHERGTLLLHESPNRLGRTLADLAAILGAERQAAVGRELTKLHEEIVRGALGELAARYETQNVAGEVVIAVAGNREKALAPTEEALDEAIDAALHEQGLSVRDAADLLSRKYGLPRKKVYQRAVERSGKA